MKKKSSQFNLNIFIWLAMALIIPHSIQAQTWTGRQKAIKQNSATSKKKTTAFGKGSTKNKVHATTVSEATGFVGRNGYVDLSLPSGTLWARCNLGDVFPNSFGHRYSWGDPRMYFGGISKADGLDIEDIAGLKDYDAATYDWGESWQTPTSEQWEELIDKCKWQWVSIRGGYEGFKITGPNGNSIFLPPAGWSDGKNIAEAHKSGYYWTSSSYPGNRVIVVSFDKSGPSMFWDYRSNGYSIRPVIKAGILP